MTISKSPAAPAWQASAALVAATALWGGNFVIGRALRGVIDPEWLNLLRWSLALLAYLPFAGPVMWRHRTAMWRYRWRLAGLGATGVFGFQQGTYMALTTTPVANAVLMVATVPVLILGVSAATGHVRPTPLRLAAVALSLLGVAILLGRGDPRAVLALDLGPGDLWLIFAVVCWTVYTLMLRNAPRDLPPAAGLGGSILAALPLLVGGAAVAGHTDLAAVPFPVWIAVLYVGVGAALLAFVAWGIGVRGKGPEAAGLYLNLIPVFAIALAYVFLGEGISGGQLAGAAVILAALVLGGLARN